MKHTLSILWILLATFAARAEAASPTEQFVAAQTAYAQGDVEEAVDHYRALIDAGYRLPEVWYNLGNSLYRLGQQPAAIHAFESAHLLAPGDGDIRANLNTVIQEAGAATAPRPEWQLAVLGISLPTWQIITGIGWWGFFLLSGIAVLRGSGPGFLRKVSGLFLIAALIGGAGWGLHHYASNQQQVVLTAADVPARFQPIPDGTPRFTLAPGSVAWLVEQREGWWAIRSGEETGWVPAKACTLIDP